MPGKLKLTNDQILARIKADFVTGQKFMSHLMQAKRQGLDPVLLVGDRRIHLSTTGFGQRGTLPVKYDPVW